MDRRDYEAIKIKIEKDESEVWKEINDLQKERASHTSILEKEKKKLTLPEELFSNGTISSSFFKKTTYNPELIKKEAKIISMIDEYLQNQNAELERIKEKKKLIDELRREKINEWEKKQRKKEEEELIEFKHHFRKKESGGD